MKNLLYLHQKNHLLLFVVIFSLIKLKKDLMFNYCCEKIKIIEIKNRNTSRF